MTIFSEWCRDWNIDPDAQKDLMERFLFVCSTQDNRKDNSEAAVQNHDRYLFSKEDGGILWRNNCGVASDAYGNFFRYGLCNDSPKIGKMLKSGDCIGIRPVRIMPHHVGLWFGQFVSREYKAPGWKWRGTEREKAQMAWANLVISMGGDASFVTGKVK